MVGICWNICFFLGWPIFRGELLVLRSVANSGFHDRPRCLNQLLNQPRVKNATIYEPLFSSKNTFDEGPVVYNMASSDPKKDPTKIPKMVAGQINCDKHCNSGYLALSLGGSCSLSQKEQGLNSVRTMCNYIIHFAQVCGDF